MDTNNPQNPNTNPITPNPQDPKIRPIRTLEEDMRDAMQSKNMSKIKIAIAESEAHSGTQSISNTPRNQGFTKPIQRPLQPRSEYKPSPKIEPVIKSSLIPDAKPFSNLNNSSVENFESKLNISENQVKINATEAQNTEPNKIGIGRMIQNNLDGSTYRREQELNSQIPTQNQILEQAVYDQTIVNSEEIPKNFSFPWKNLLMGLFILLFLAGGGYGGYYLYSISTLANNEPAKKIEPVENVSTIIPADENKKFIVGISDKIETTKLISAIGATLAKDKIRNIYFRKDSSMRDGGSDISIQTFLEMSDIKIPEQLYSSLKGDFMLGVYSNGVKNSPFIISKVSFFQGALAAMLRFENDMRMEFTPLFVSESGILSSSNTGEYSLKNFTDELIENKDVRALKKGPSEEDTIILYSFIDQDNLVITTNEETLRAVVNSYNKRKIVR